MPEDLRAYHRRIRAIHEALGIPADFAENTGMPIQPECDNLVETEPDLFGRQPLMEADAHAGWQAMKAGAGREGIELVIVSAFRSAEYQRGIFAAKLARGHALAEILKVNAPPGYSEHHSGLAVDVGCPDLDPLDESFEQSPAFQWLRANAGVYGFSLSFPRDNPYGVLYEPWHWKFIPT